ncbi:HpcH/HpaI aldolase/citrate lyase domain protein [Leptospira inadai serovar Lyme str. 10]|uniref:HpcH/HpaI aldolase/citrate lyase domain protein n=2 Tax=Leptospira inadai serovar Lyme TaxID=293084 RepID=V6HP43_9LEPT|nr:aldolase/citrate lyase family protein [Leptospira inadai]EQA38640.1 HpcH/HpaI aldolase/citrate lyase domain protein [Leptospira inadai serovar Lyme str. 10]PNV72407.1 aldolase [Leptospira inadai serovar Lyme]
MKEQIDRKIIELRRYLISLTTTYPIVGLKGGTETEDMDAEEIRILHLVAKDVAPVTVKIGGPEARTDIRMLVKEEIEGISAPMIESAYALKNFISTLRSMLPPVTFRKVSKAMNLETITGYKNLLEIVDSKSFEELDQVTAARSDLSASMGLIPDDEEVMKVTKTIVAISKDRGKKTSVGGTITKQNFRKIAEEIGPDKINSRHVCVDAKRSVEKGAEEVAEAMLQFEIELYDLLSILKPEKAFAYKNRMETNRERIGSRKVLYSIR